MTAITGGEDGFKRQRLAALYPFAALCVASVAVFVMVKVTVLGRPALKTLEQARAEMGGQTPADKPPPVLMDGKPMPDAELPLLNGKMVKLSSYRGKVLFVNLWATWCAPCKDEMPSMEKLYQAVKAPNFEMLAVSIDKEGKKVVEPFVKELGLTFPVLLDPQQVLAPQLKITGVPETFLVSPEGIILHHLVGPAQWDRPEIIDALRSLIRKTAAGAADTTRTK